MNVLNVLIIEQISNNNDLEKILVNQRIKAQSISVNIFNIQHITDSIKPNVILFNTSELTEEIIQNIVNIYQVYAVPIIVFSDDADSKAINKVIKAGVSAFVVNGLESKRIRPIIDIAIVRFNEQKKLKDELTKTKSKLEERKVIDRAKGILTKTRGLSEDESYHTLRKLAMNRNIAISEMAKNVISMAELLR